MEGGEKWLLSTRHMECDKLILSSTWSYEAGIIITPFLRWENQGTENQKCSIHRHLPRKWKSWNSNPGLIASSDVHDRTSITILGVSLILRTSLPHPHTVPTSSAQALLGL